MVVGSKISISFTLTFWTPEPVLVGLVFSVWSRWSTSVDDGSPEREVGWNDIRWVS